jgi:hypothetical protein
MLGRAVGWPLGVAVGLLAFVGAAASVTHYLQEPYNPGFLRFPTVVALHVVLGGVYLALAPFQFVKRIRSRHLGYHRKTGAAHRRWSGGRGNGPVHGAGDPLLWLAGAGDHRPLRRTVPRISRQRLRLRPGRAGEPAPGVDDPGVRHSAVYRHDAADLHPRDDHSVHTNGRADRRAVGDVLYGGIRRARLRSGALDPCHPQERHPQCGRGEAA